MRRREFCKLIAAAAAAKAMPAMGQSGAATPTVASAPSGFNTLRQTYEEFCATPQGQRVFYALVDGKIVEQKLDDANWEPSGWGNAARAAGSGRLVGRGADGCAC